MEYADIKIAIDRKDLAFILSSFWYDGRTFRFRFSNPFTLETVRFEGNFCPMRNYDLDNALITLRMKRGDEGMIKLAGTNGKDRMIFYHWHQDRPLICEQRNGRYTEYQVSPGDDHTEYLF